MSILDRAKKVAVPMNSIACRPVKIAKNISEEEIMELALAYTRKEVSGRQAATALGLKRESQCYQCYTFFSSRVFRAIASGKYKLVKS